LAGENDELSRLRRMREEYKAAMEEEDRLREEWVEHLNNLSPAKEEVSQRMVEPLAFRVLERDDAREDSKRLAQAYLDAIRKRQDATPR
jgi:hypothetical protein